MKLLQQFSLVLCAMVACSGTPAQTPKQGGTLNLIVRPEPPSINLGSSKLGPSSFVGSKIYEGLITLSPKLESIPRLAESWAVEAISRAPKHAYTRQLFEAMPSRVWEERAERLSGQTATDLELIVENLASKSLNRNGQLLSNFHLVEY